MEEYNDYAEFEVTIEGMSPLVMHRLDVNDLIAAQSGSKSRTQRQHNPDKEAFKNAYWMTLEGKQVLYVPTRAIFSALKNASRYVKVGRFSALATFLGTITINPMEEIPLLDIKGKPTDKYNPFTQALVINNSRVPVTRPRIDTWRLKFTLCRRYPEISDGVLEEIVKYSGTKSGLMEHRPSKGGYFGTFKLIDFKKK
jgi:hypothetical protein